MKSSSGRILLTLVALGGLCLGGCGGDGDGSSATIDLNGVYRWHVDFTQVECGSRDVTENVTTVQNGDDVTFQIPADAGVTVPISGTVDGNEVQASGTYENKPWALILDIDAASGDGGATLTGTMVFNWINTSQAVGCTDRANFSATRI